MKRGLGGVPLGVARYFRDVMDDLITKLELPEDESWEVETHNDWLCHVPRSVQPVLIATAEHLITLAVDVAPHLAYISMVESTR